MSVCLFGAICRPACANFALKQSAVDHHTEFSEANIKAVNECFYVDNCLKSAPSFEKAKPLLSELVSLLAKIGFRKTKLVSNIRSAVSSVPFEDRSKKLLHLDFSCNPLP